MPYKRPEAKKPEKEHPLQTEFGVYGINSNNDEGWVCPHLTQLHDDGRFALHQFSNAIDAVKSTALNDFKPEVATVRRTELVLKGKRALLSFLKKHVEKSKSDVNAVKNKILRVTEPETFSDPTKALLAELRNQEIRNLIRNTPPKQRHDLIKNNIEFIKAIVGSPDEIINKENLETIRREYAFKKDSSLISEEKDQILIYKAVRKRAAEVNAAASKMLIYSKIDDPTPPSEHFAVFEPETEYESVHAKNRIQAWDKKQSEIEKDKEFEEKNKGINLEIPERLERVRNRFGRHTN